MRRLLASVFALLLTCSTVFAASTIELAVDTATSALTTELNSLASNGWTAASAAIDNRIGQTLKGYTICRVEGNFTYAANPTAGGAFIGYFLKNVDGTNYENTPTSSVGLNRLPDFVLPATTGQTGTRVMVDVRCPAERFKVVGQNASTGQAMAASGNTVKILNITLQGQP